MGYRSDVVLALNKEGFEYFITSLSMTDANTKEQVIGLLSRAENNLINKKGSVLFVFNGINWYESYPEISFIDNVVNYIIRESGNDNNISNKYPECSFHRIGEDDADVDTFESNDTDDLFDVRLVRSIDYDNYSGEYFENVEDFLTKATKGETP